MKWEPEVSDCVYTSIPFTYYNTSYIQEFGGIDEIRLPPT